MTVKRVIFIRPGETDWNQAGRWQGWVAVPLNQHGRQQAQQLAKYVRNIGMSALYTSDLKRAADTAALLAERLSFDPILDERLRERSIGHWQGLTVEEMKHWYSQDYEHLLSDPDGFRVPGGESRHDVQARMLAVFNEILAQDRGETVGILSHTTAIHVLLAALIPDGHASEVAVSNTSVTTIVLGEDGRWHLVAADDITHLEGLATKRAPEIEGV